MICSAFPLANSGYARRIEGVVQRFRTGDEWM
jgi:hypothetical protein